MESFDIKIDKDGVWYYKGAHMFRKEILHVFYEHLRIDECGRYLIELGPERSYLDVEDTVFVVSAVYKTKNSHTGLDQIEIVLNDDSCEILEMNTLSEGRDYVLYCRVKEGTFVARFSRKSYYQLAEFIEPSENDDCFFINLNGNKYFIANVQVAEAPSADS
jgi:hypothetical protein